LRRAAELLAFRKESLKCRIFYALTAAERIFGRMLAGDEKELLKPPCGGTGPSNL
jgi:hypothetical protein